MSCPSLNSKQLHQIVEILKRARSRKVPKEKMTKKNALQFIKEKLETVPPARKQRKRKNTKLPLLYLSGKNKNMKLFTVKGKGYYYPEKSTRTVLLNQKNF
mgnify:CR=1 FL=1|tara:strand:+ start:871 stop:1173 length:303 start_codon:yes stop_codon:yes gene_type:complete